MSCNQSGFCAFGNSWWWIIILLLIFGSGNNGCGNRALVGTKKAKEALEVFFSHRGIRRRSL